MTEETVEKCICKPCGRVFDEMSEAIQHTSGHRTKPYQAQTGRNKVSPKDMIRFVETTERELETRTLHGIAGVEPPEESDTETVYLTENEREETREGKLWEWGE